MVFQQDGAITYFRITIRMENFHGNWLTAAKLGLFVPLTPHPGFLLLKVQKCCTLHSARHCPPLAWRIRVTQLQLCPPRLHVWTKHYDMCLDTLGALTEYL
jgi:hypothetical protein